LNANSVLCHDNLRAVVMSNKHIKASCTSDISG
jgi:hypothetical protein